MFQVGGVHSPKVLDQVIEDLTEEEPVPELVVELVMSTSLLGVNEHPDQPLDEVPLDDFGLREDVVQVWVSLPRVYLMRDEHRNRFYSFDSQVGVGY